MEIGLIEMFLQKNTTYKNEITGQNLVEQNNSLAKNLCVLGFVFNELFNLFVEFYYLAEGYDQCDK